MKLKALNYPFKWSTMGYSLGKKEKDQRHLQEEKPKTLGDQRSRWNHRTLCKNLGIKSQKERWFFKDSYIRFIIFEVELGWVRTCYVFVYVSQSIHLASFLQRMASYLFFRVYSFVFFWMLSSKVVWYLFGKVLPIQVLKIKCVETNNNNGDDDSDDEWILLFISIRNENNKPTPVPAFPSAQGNGYVLTSGQD